MAFDLTNFATFHANSRSANCARSAPLRHHLQPIARPTTRSSQVCISRPEPTRLVIVDVADGRGRRQRRMRSTRTLAFLRAYLERAVVVVGGDQHFDELAIEDDPGGRRIERRVEGDDAAEGRGRIGGVGALVGLEQPRPTATPQGLACLTMTQAGARELAHAFPAPRRIGEVVVGQLLALQLGEGGQRAGRRPQVAVERGLLVRVLAVAQVHHLGEAPLFCAGNSACLPSSPIAER
jgi:hypothetical protein